jgi:muramoyltetrapeptide carboxypeptidase
MCGPRRPPALRAGDTVRLVSPSGPAEPELVARGTELFTSWGLRVEVARRACDGTGYLAGDDDGRLADLSEALADPAVRGVVCTRGGYGAQRIVDRLDLAPLLQRPKVVVGFSDITAVHLALWRRLRLATVYGPGAAWRDERTGKASAQSLRAAIMSAEPVLIKSDPAETTAAVRIAGVARGTLLGGNLSLLTTSVGTADFPSMRGAILLLEDTDEAAYAVDRMLTYLLRSGVLRGLAGVAVGQFTACSASRGVSVADVLLDRLATLGVPTLGGLPIGHGTGQLSVPIGVPATLDAAAGTLLAQPAVG